MFDFGLARQYTTLTGQVRQPRSVAGFRGTVRYASLNTHLSKELGRHDDLWSVFYLLVELATGHLPWSRIKDKDEVGRMKEQEDCRRLIAYLPMEFASFLHHLKQLTYFDRPDYLLIMGSLQKATKRLGIQDYEPMDWEGNFSDTSITESISTPRLSVMNYVKGFAMNSFDRESSRHMIDSPDVENMSEKKQKVQLRKEEVILKESIQSYGSSCEERETKAAPLNSNCHNSDVSPQACKRLECNKNHTNSNFPKNQTEFRSRKICLDHDANFSPGGAASESNNAIIHPGECMNDKVGLVRFGEPTAHQKAPSFLPTIQETDRSNRDNTPNLEVVPSPVTFSPRPPNHSPPKNYFLNLLARKHNFFRCLGKKDSK